MILSAKPNPCAQLNAMIQFANAPLNSNLMLNALPRVEAQVFEPHGLKIHNRASRPSIIAEARPILNSVVTRGAEAVRRSGRPMDAGFASSERMMDAAILANRLDIISRDSALAMMGAVTLSSDRDIPTPLNPYATPRSEFEMMLDEARVDMFRSWFPEKFILSVSTAMSFGGSIAGFVGAMTMDQMYAKVGIFASSVILLFTSAVAVHLAANLCPELKPVGKDTSDPS